MAKNDNKDVNPATQEDTQEVSNTEKQAEEIIKAAEKKAEEMVKAAEKRIEEMFNKNAIKETTPQVANITIEQPKKEVASLPDNIKRMQEELKKETHMTLFEDGDKYVDDKFISVNGQHRYQVSRGKDVKVPGYIRMINDMSEKQDTATQKLMRKKQQESLKKLDAAGK